jgi:hypothetical protein
VGFISAFVQEADKEHWKSRQETLEPLFNTFTENHAHLWVEVHQFNLARYYTAYDADAKKLCTTWLGSIPRVQMLERLAWCIELGPYHIADSARHASSIPSRRAWIPFHQKIEGSSEPTLMDLARNALSKKKEPCTVKTCNTYNDIVQSLNELGEDWKVYVPSELHGSASISAAWPSEEHGEAVKARLVALGCRNAEYAVGGLCVPFAKLLGKQICQMVVDRKQMVVAMDQRPDPDPFTTMANDAHAGVLKSLVAMGPEAAAELLFAEQISRGWAESSKVDADLVFGLPATTHRLKQAFAQPKLHSVVIYVVNYLFDQDELTPDQMAAMEPCEETVQHSIHALELVFDPDSKSIVFADPNGALIPGSNMEFVCVPAEKRDSPASTRHGCCSRWEKHRWVVPDGADGPRFDESNANLHKIVTKCRLSAGLVSAYYDDTPKSFLWQEPSRYSAGPAASQKAAKDAGLLIGSTHVQQAEYLDALTAAAYVLDYPLLALEEPSIPRFAEFAGQEDSRLVFAFFAAHAVGEVNQGGSSWRFDTSCECKKVVIFNASTCFLLLNDATLQLQNYSFEPWSVYHVERATKARVKSIVIQAHDVSYPFIVLGYEDKPSAKLAAVGSGKRKKTDSSNELARLQPAKVDETAKYDRKVATENGSAQRKVASLIKTRAGAYLTRGTGEKPNTKWHELVHSSKLLADKEAAGFFTGAFIPGENEANLESLVRLSMQLAEAYPNKVVNWTQHPVLGRYMKKMTIVVEDCGWAEQPAMHSKDEVVDADEEARRRETILYLPKDKYFGKNILKMVLTAKNRIPTECWEQVVDKDVVIASITLIIPLI